MKQDGGAVERPRLPPLEQISYVGFGEYFEPFTGELLGSEDQSWTAAIALDWLASGPPKGRAAA